MGSQVRADGSVAIPQGGGSGGAEYRFIERELRSGGILLVDHEDSARVIPVRFWWRNGTPWKLELGEALGDPMNPMAIKQGNRLKVSEFAALCAAATEVGWYTSPEQLAAGLPDSKQQVQAIQEREQKNPWDPNRRS